MSETIEKEIHIRLHGPDREIVDAMKRRYGCTTTAAIRACIRIAAEVKLDLAGSPTRIE